MILIIFFAFVAFLLWFYREISRNEMLKDVSGGHEVPLIKPGLDLAYSDSENIFKFPRKCAAKFGRTYRTNFLVFFHGLEVIRAADAEIILKTSKHIDKSKIYEILHPFLRTGLLTSNGEKWHLRRRMLTPAFHFDIINEYLEVFRDESNRLVEDLRLAVGKETDILPISTQYTLNTICESAMGVNLRDLGDKGKIYKRNLYELGLTMLDALVKPWLKFTIIADLTGHSKKLQGLLEPIHEFTKLIYTQRLQAFESAVNVTKDDNANENIYFKKKRRYAMMDTLLHAKRENLIDEEGILEETDTFTFEGHDTTSAAMTYTLLLLSHHPEIQDQLFDEINATANEIERDEFLIEDFNKLELMDRVLRESMRIYPPVHFISRVLTEDINYKGLKLPKDRLVNIHIFDVHRDPEIFPDPEKFDPDRFLPENCATRNNFAFIAFSAGMRNCIGQKFALLELKMMLLKVVRNFKISPITRREELVFIADMILRTKHPIKMKFMLRD